MATQATGHKAEGATLAAISIPRPLPSAQQAVARPKWKILIVLCLSTFMLLLDTTIVNVAVPTIMRDFKTDLAAIEWVLNGYILALAVLLITFGRLADLYGRRLFFIGGTLAFAAASVLCGIAPNPEVLVVGRVLQGMAAAATLPAALSIATVTFSKKQRGLALGLMSATSGIAAALGPILGGLLTEGSSWRWVFFINLPVGVLAAVGALLFVYESVDRQAKRAIDYLGVLTVSVALFALTYALVEGQRYGWTSPTILGLLALSVAAMVVFAIVERNHVSPLLDLSLFRNRTFVAANATGMVMMFGMIGVLFMVTLFLQVVLGFGALSTGLAMTPMALAMMISAPFAGRLSDRIGSRLPIFVGLLVGAGGLFWLGSLSLHTSWSDLLIPMAMAGFGIGAGMAPMTAVVMASAPLGKEGNASGTLNTMRQIGSVLGISVLGAILQHQLVANLSGVLASLPLPAGLRDQIVEQLNSGAQVQSLAAAAGASGPLAAQIKQLFDEQLIASLNQTLIVGAAVVFVGALTALLIGNHVETDRVGRRSPPGSRQDSPAG